MSPRTTPTRLTARYAPRQNPVQFRKNRPEFRKADPEPAQPRGWTHGPTIREYLGRMSAAEWELWHGMHGPVSPAVTAMVAKAMAHEGMGRLATATLGVFAA